MRLIEDLKKVSDSDESMFRRHLAREDIARLDKLISMARAGMTRDQFLKNGHYIGWTQNDMTTHRLKDELDALLEALLDYSVSGSKADEEKINDAWAAFAQARLQKLIHCL
jgi:hypothetical protein